MVPSVPQSNTTLPESIKIDDVTSGKVSPETIYKELERLKVEINILRNDMSLFLKAIAVIPSNQSQVEYYKVISSRLQVVQASIKDYTAQYNKLLPIINLAQIKLGSEVEILPTQNGIQGSESDGVKPLDTSNNRKKSAVSKPK